MDGMARTTSNRSGRWSRGGVAPPIVAAPSLLKGTLPTAPADLADYPWLEELGTTEASNWLRSRGVDKITTRGRVQVPGNLRLDGARDGQGVAVAVRHFVEADLMAGRLVELFSDNDWGGYHIVRLPDPTKSLSKFRIQPGGSDYVVFSQELNEMPLGNVSSGSGVAVAGRCPVPRE